MAINEELDFLVSRVDKVRKWLAAIAVLKTAAIIMLFVCGYIGVYILLDHWLNFGALGRLTAFFLLIGTASFLVYRLSRLLLVQVSYTNAANFIENNYSLNQQLVAAMEYYDNEDNYPYSKALAEQLILRVNKDSESFRFDSVVEKWRGFALGAFVFLGLSIVGFYVQHNLSFLKTYLARLAVPFASVAPVPATSLETLTGDIVSEPESMVVMSAAIKGRVPDTGQLIIAATAPDANNQQIQLRPVVESGEQPKFETSEFFPNTGQFKYRFGTGKVTTQWQNIDIREAPGIKSISAEIELPEYISDEDALKNYTEQVKNNKLELIKNSTVTLHVEATGKLSEVELTEPSGVSKSRKLEEASTFTHTFTADMEGPFEFHLTDEKGLKSRNIPNLKITLKKDNPPQFKLAAPDGDYIATNVSSVPIEFEITDDFGLSSARFIAEFPDGEPLSLDIPVKPDSNEAAFRHILELEEYNLEVGDSIMFYAQAQDVKTAISDSQNTASSGIYFIEIRPYQQIWHLGDEGSPSNMPGPIPEDLVTLLEYTRAFVKKTSVIASKTRLDSDDYSKLRSIREDVDYCSNLLVRLRDDPQIEFNDDQKTVLNEILANYEKASGSLDGYDVSGALTSEKEAYRILRKFIQEMEMEYNPPESGTSVPQETPDRAELKASIEPPEIEKERIEDELEKVQNDIEQLHAEQEQLKTELEKVLEAQKEANKEAQANSQAGQQSSESSDSSQQQKGEGGEGESGGSNQQDSSGQQGEGSSGQGQSGNNQQGDSQQKGEGGAGQSGSSQSGNSQQQGEGSSGQGESSNGQQSTSQQQGRGTSGQGSGENQQNSSQQQGEGSSGEGQSDGNQQSATQQQGRGGPGEGSDNQEGTSQKQGAGSLGQGGGKQLDNNQDRANSQSGAQSASDISDSGSYEQSQSRNIADAQLKMLQARQAQLERNVSQLKQKLESMPQSPDASAAEASKEAQEQLGEAADYMKEFQDKMNELRYEPQDYDKKSAEASELMDSAAKKLESADQALENGLKGSQEEQLAKQLKDTAEQLALDASMADKDLTELEREQMQARRDAAERLLKSMARPQWASGGGGANNSISGSLVWTKGSGDPSVDTTREISRQIWSLRIELQKRLEKPVEDEPSDSRFSEFENDFFENAAKYNSGDGEK